MSERHRLTDLEDGGTHCEKCNKVWFSRKSAETDHRAIGLGDATEAQLLISFDNALADYVLANKYECSHHLIPDIRRWMSEVSTEMAARGITYSHEKARLSRDSA